MLAFNSSGAVVAAGSITGTGSVAQIGTGTTILTGHNVYSGGTVIAAGALQIGNGGSTGSVGTGPVLDDAALVFNRSGTVIVPGAITGTGSLTQNGVAGGTTILAGTNTYSGGTTISAGTLQIGDGGADGSIVGDVSDNGTLAFNRPDVTMFEGTVSGTGGVAQIGPGATILTAANTYTGTTAISAGSTLIVEGSIDGSAITNAGSLQAAAGGTITAPSISNSAGGTITNSGAITGPLSNSGAIANNTLWTGDVLSNGGSIVSSGTWKGGVDGNGGLIVNSGSWTGNVASNMGGIANNGAWTGDLASNTGSIANNGTWTAANFTNNAGGTVMTSGTLNVTATLNNAGDLNAAGALSALLINNSGLFSATSGPLGGVIGTFNNSGLLNLVNGATDNTFSAMTYNGQGGRLAIDVDPTSTAPTQRADLLKVTNLSGSTMITINSIGTTGVIGTPIPVIEAMHIAPGTAVTLGNGPSIINYQLEQAGGTYSIVSTLNTSVASGTLAGLDAVVTALNTGFFQSSDALIADPPNPEKNQWNGGPWIRIADGQNTVTSQTTAQNVTGPANQPAKDRTDFDGFQTGVDGGVANIGGLGWSTHFGLTAGQVEVRTNSLLESNILSQAQVPFVGLYGAVTGHNFFADAQLRKDFYSLSLDNPELFLEDRPLHGKAIGANASAGYRFDLPSSWFIEPSAAFIYSRLNVQSLGIGLNSTSSTFGTLSFDPLRSALGRAGVRVGTTYLFERLQLQLQPFLSASVWREFAGSAGTSFSTGNASIPLNVTRIGNFAQIGVGLAGRVAQSGLIGFLRGDYRIGDSIRGYDLVAGLRYEF